MCMFFCRRNNSLKYHSFKHNNIVCDIRSISMTHTALACCPYLALSYHPWLSFASHPLAWCFHDHWLPSQIRSTQCSPARRFPDRKLLRLIYFIWCSLIWCFPNHWPLILVHLIVMLSYVTFSRLLATKPNAHLLSTIWWRLGLKCPFFWDLGPI